MKTNYNLEIELQRDNRLPVPARGWSWSGADRAMSVGVCGPLGGSESPLRSLGGLRTPAVLRQIGKSTAEIFVTLSAIYGDEVLLNRSAV